MIALLENAPLSELWEINALISLWQVARQHDRSITFAQVARAYEQQYEQLEVTEDNAIEVTVAIAQLIREKANDSTRTAREAAKAFI